MYIINLKFSSLPIYAACSLARAFAALFISLLFSIVYGKIAASSLKRERWMIPLLDILQSVPVLGFLPALAVVVMALFHGSRVGLEILSILMIFTSQGWNITFSLYNSIKQVPPGLKEVAQVYRFSPIRQFLWGELPFGMIPLVWNCMMSVAGGWFFLMICEAFVLRGKDFRLLGLGSYMSVAIEQGDKKAIVAGSLTMLALILILEIFLWRPLISWSKKFKWEEMHTKAVADPFFYRLLKKSPLADKIMYAVLLRLNRVVDSIEQRFKKSPPKIFRHLFAAAAFLFSLFGVFKLGLFMISVPVPTWGMVLQEAFWTTLRVFFAVLLASVWTIPVGAVIGFFPKLTRIFQPFVQIAAAFPVPMLFPLILILLRRWGIGMEVASALLLMLGVQWYLLFNTIAGASSIPQNFKELGAIYRFPLRLWSRKVIGPALFPFLVTGWITAAGGAWNASIVAEYVPYKGDVFMARGLGSLISRSAETNDMALLSVCLIVMVTLVVGINRLCWKKLNFMAETKYALGE